MWNRFWRGCYLGVCGKTVSGRSFVLAVRLMDEEYSTGVSPNLKGIEQDGRFLALDRYLLGG